MSYTKAIEPVVVSVPLGALAATATAGAFTAQWAGEVTRAELVDDTAITGDAANRYDFAVNKGTIGSPISMATLSLLAGVNVAASTGRAFTLNATTANRRFGVGDVVHVVATKNGTAGNLGARAKVNLFVIPVYDHASE